MITFEYISFVLNLLVSGSCLVALLTLKSTRIKAGAEAKGAEHDAKGKEIENEEKASKLLMGYNGIFINLESLQMRNRMNSNVITMLAGDSFTKWQSLFFASTSTNIYLGMKQDVSANLSPINGVLVIPYDTPTLQSQYPKFLAPINRDVEIAYLNDTPIKFNDLIGLGITPNVNLAECGDWAVTNASHVWADLVTLPNVLAKPPKIKYYMLSLIANNTL